MKDLKMAELKFEAPLAKCETEEWLDFSEFQGSDNNVTNLNNHQDSSRNKLSENCPELADNFTETYSGSLEDLVNTFDTKITECFKNYEESAEKIAPVQVRSQEELMNECPMWWTLTGNYGNILPIDWSKSYARSLHIPALHLRERHDSDNNNVTSCTDDDDELLGQQLDMHSMIITSLHQEPMVTAEDVLEEIDDILTESPPDQTTKSSAKRNENTLDDDDRMDERPISQLYDLIERIEYDISVYSETLVHELAVRDEGEYEKEMKNQFISLLLTVQNKRRQVPTLANHNNNMNSLMSNSKSTAGTYVTTVIPYHHGTGTPSLHTLQILIKILRAINDDSPSVPGLLTDYILKVLCPTA